MQPFVKTILSAVVVLGMASAVAFAADLPLPPPKAKPEQVQPKSGPKSVPAELDRLGEDCVEASNGCQHFRRAADGTFDPLNNIGIACQPQPLACTKRR